MLGRVFLPCFLKMILFIFGCAGSSLLCWVSLVVGSGGYSLAVAQ